MDRPPVLLITYLASLFLINDIITVQADWSYRSCLELSGHFERDRSLELLWARGLCQESLRVLWQERLARGAAMEILARARGELDRTAWSRLGRKKLVRKSLTLKSLLWKGALWKRLVLILALKMLAVGWLGHDIFWLVTRQPEHNVLLPCVAQWEYQKSRRAYELDRESGRPIDSIHMRIHLHLHTTDLLIIPGLVVRFAVRKDKFD